MILTDGTIELLKVLSLMALATISEIILILVVLFFCVIFGNIYIYYIFPVYVNPMIKYFDVKYPNLSHRTRDANLEKIFSLIIIVISILSLIILYPTIESNW